MYPPPYGQPPPYQYQQPPRPPRSAIPRVVGIIGCAFAALGFGGSALFTFGPLTDIHRWDAVSRLGEVRGVATEPPDLSTITNWLYAWMALSVVVFGLHLVGSILAITYRRTGLKLLTSYGVGALFLIAIDMVMCHGFVPKHGDHDLYGSIAVSHTIFSAIAFVWPVIVLALINSRRAREACS